MSKESELSDDGYTKEHAPGDLYKRRLWGAGSFQWRRPLLMGDHVQQSTRVVKAEIKGSNLYVHLEKIIFKDNIEDWSIKENRSMIYLKEEQNRKIRDGPVMSKNI
jgi:hydroxyacyl-ACP dehydratase HTD2-like protein with hotdog domain